VIGKQDNRDKSEEIDYPENYQKLIYLQKKFTELKEKLNQYYLTGKKKK